MSKPFIPLCDIAWSPKLAIALADASSALGRLDARVSASSIEKAWFIRAAWFGYHTALQLQGHEIDEIDLICLIYGVRMKGRPNFSTNEDITSGLDDWKKSLTKRSDEHWNTALPFTFERSDKWHDAPALVQAITICDQWVRNTGNIDGWLHFPILITQLKIALRPLPCLVIGTKQQRHRGNDREAILIRLLNQVQDAAIVGLARLRALENHINRAQIVAQATRRSQSIVKTTVLSLRRPVFTPRDIAAHLGISISGAGKLLAKCEKSGLVHSMNSTESWRHFASADVGVLLRLVPDNKGRPVKVARASPAPSAESILARFDAEMAEFEAVAGRHSPEKVIR